MTPQEFLSTIAAHPAAKYLRNVDLAGWNEVVFHGNGCAVTCRETDLHTWRTIGRGTRAFSPTLKDALDVALIALEAP